MTQLTVIITINILEHAQLNSINHDLISNVHPSRQSLRFIFIVGTALQVPTVQEVLKSLIALAPPNMQVVFVDPVAPKGFAKKIADIHVCATADAFAVAIKNAVNPHDRLTRVQPIPEKRVTRVKKRVYYKIGRIHDDSIYRKQEKNRKVAKSKYIKKQK